MKLYFMLFFIFISSVIPQIVVNIETNLQRLLEEEDTDGDKKITVEDKQTKETVGDKRFFIIDENGKKLEIIGTYYLSNLLQEMSLQKKIGREKGILQIKNIFQDPVERLSSQIQKRFWAGLTRRIDASSLEQILSDSKTKTKDGFHYLYVPSQDEIAYQYFASISQQKPSLSLKIVRLPEKITPQWVKELEGFHGILTLGLRKNKEGHLEGIPFIVPGGRFNEMYGWDSYFEALGLLEDGYVDLAKDMVDNFVYEITYYGKILNANRTYYLTRSQPPFLSSMLWSVYKALPQNLESKEWLKRSLLAAIEEYNKVWMGKDRLTAIGLNRYYGEGLGQPPEVEEGHFDAAYHFFAQKHKIAKEKLETHYKKGEMVFPDIDAYFTHDRSMRESGHDTTYRWEDRCADFATVDLNSLLYKTESDIAKILQQEFDGKLIHGDGREETSNAWLKRSQDRKKLMNQYLWNEEDGVFYDYDLANQRQKKYMNATAFYPLWANLATQEQAQRIVEKAIPSLEEAGGIAGSTQEARGEISKERPARQWDYPYGWAPHQIIAWHGLLQYNYDKIVHRLVYRWLYTITRNAVDYNGVVPEKFDVVKRTHQVFAEYGNVGTEFAYITEEGFGWMNASYQIGLNILPNGLLLSLEKLISPEWIFYQKE